MPRTLAPGGSARLGGTIPVAVEIQKRRFPFGPIALIAVVYAAAYLVWQRSDWGSPAFRDLLSNIAFMPLNVAVLTLYSLAARSPVLDPGVRRALRFLALGSVLVFTGNSISTWYLVGLGENPPVSWADPFYLADSLCTLAALLSFPLARRTRMERWKFVLDAAMVLVGGAVAIWFWSVRPASEGDSSLVQTFLAYAYPLAGLLLLLGITTVLLRRPVDGNRLAFGMLVTGVTLSIVADLTFTYITRETGGRTESWVDAVYMIVYLLLISSAERYYRHPQARLEGATLPRPRTQPVSPLPYVAVAATYGLLLLTVVSPWTDPVSGVAIGALLVTALVVARQLLTVRENVRLLADTAARQNEARFRSLVQHSSDVIMVTRPNGTMRFVSPSASRVFGYEPAALLGRPIATLLHPADRDRATQLFAEVVGGPGVIGPVEWRFRQADGSWLHAEILATNLLGDPTVRGIVLNTRDVSERKRLEEQLTHQAFHDPLTGLANRALFRDRVSHALALAQRQGHPITVLFLDLDDFKRVNDSLGHAEGDRLLIAAAERFQSCARAADTVSRLGGDEFAILIEHVAGSDGRPELLQRLEEAMTYPFALSGNQVQVSASIGVATAIPGDTADDLLRNADVAMYAAKRRGKGRSETYELRMYADVRERLEMEAALRTALETNQLSLHYQPIVSLKTGALYGIEALVRWDHPHPGPPAAPELHHPGGRDRPDRAAGRVGADRGLPAGAGMAGGVPRDPALRVGEHLGPAAPGRRRHRRAARGPRRHRGQRRRRGPRDHRERADAADRDGAGAAAGSSSRSACGSPSTISAPATPRSATCSASRSTSSRSPSRSWTTSGRAPRSRPWPGRSSGWARRSSSAPSPRGSSGATSAPRCSSSAATWARGTTSPGRCHPTGSPGCSRPGAPRPSGG